MGKCNFKIGDIVRVREDVTDENVRGNDLSREQEYKVIQILPPPSWDELELLHVLYEPTGMTREVFATRFEIVETAPINKSPITSCAITPWEEAEDETRDSLLAKVSYFENEMSCYIQIAEMRKQHINELEKENEELKEELWVAAYGENYGE